MQNNHIPELSIHIVTWNSSLFLQPCLESLKKQSFTDFRILIIDNGSDDETAAFLAANYPHIQVIHNRTNVGFSRAHNQGIHFSSSPYILVLNPDIIAEPDFVQKLIEAIKKNEKCGSVGGKLLRFTFEEGDLKQIHYSDTIDTTGLQALRNRRIFDRGEGETDNGQFDTPMAVFGISGSAVLLRREALEEVRYQDEYFDEDFFAYKEDVDLAWRLQRRGWESRYVPEAKAYHHRTARKDGQKLGEVMRQHRHRAKFVNAFSYRNHLLLLAKNESWKSILLNFPWIFSYEAKKFVYLLFFQPSTLRQLFIVFGDLPKMRKKRKVLMRAARVSDSALRHWFQ